MINRSINSNIPKNKNIVLDENKNLNSSKYKTIYNNYQHLSKNKILEKKKKKTKNHQTFRYFIPLKSILHHYAYLHITITCIINEVYKTRVRRSSHRKKEKEREKERDREKIQESSLSCYNSWRPESGPFEIKGPCPGLG